jgi:NNP family nitrate/nitrite transporter-like MFS transporter
MKISALFRVRNPEIRALHLTWIAFFITFYVWFNMAPLATTMIREVGWLTRRELKLFAICNVALTIPMRLIVGMTLDKWGPRRVFSVLMVLCAFPTFVFAFGNSFAQLLISRLVLSSVGAGFVVGIHMTALWFKPKDIGFAEGFYAGWGNFGSAAAAMTIPTVALSIYGGTNGWRYSIATSGVIMFFYGIFYWFAITDGPKGEMLHKPKKVSAIEVSTFRDMIKLIIFTIPMIGILSLLVWRLQKMGFLGTTGAVVCHLIIGALVLYQIVQILLVNIPILKKGVPEDDKYNFNQVACLNIDYLCVFGGELAIVSMLPAFFENVFSLLPATAGLIAASFAFVNLFARPLGGVLSDTLKSRKMVMVLYMFFTAAGFLGMAMINKNWPIVLAVVLTIICSIFVQGTQGSTYAIIPMIKRRITGQISGMTGAYGNVGAVLFLTALTMFDAKTFFLLMAAITFFGFLFCLIFLKEPHGAFSEEYHISSVDRELMKEARQSLS